LLKGATRPRVELAPSYVDTFGGEGAEIMSRAGKPLDQWQRDSVQLLLSTRDDGRWACIEYCELVARQNGKGGVLEARVLAGFLLLGEKRIMWSAHEVKTSYDAFLRLQELLQALDRRSEEEKAADPNYILVEDETLFEAPIPIKVVNTNGREGFVRLDTKQRIRFIARSKSSGRGMTGDLNVIDETFAYTAAQHAALFPTMMARPNPQIIYTSTPPLDPSSGEILHKLRKRAEAALKLLAAGLRITGAAARLAFRDWGNAGDLDNLDKVDLDDRSLWAQSNPSLGGRISEEIVEQARESVPLLEFAREVLGIWPRTPDNAGTIDSKLWEQMLDVASRRVGDVGIALDIAPGRDWAAIGLAGVRADGLEHWQIIDFNRGVDWIIARLVEHRDVLDPVAIAMGKGTYASLKTDLAEAGFAEPKKADEPQRGDLMVLDYLEMSAATGGVLDVVNVLGARHIGQKELTNAAYGAKVRKTSDSVVWSRVTEDDEVCPIVSIGQARYALRTRLPLLVDEEYDVLDSIG
jgi:hypothetical protein